MKKTLTIFFLFLVLDISGQNFKTFEYGNTKIEIYADGTLRNLMIPKDSNKIALKQLNLWLGGKRNNQLHTAANFTGNPGTDFFAGALDTISGMADDTAKWNKVFMVSKTEIRNHIVNFNKPNYTIPDNIKNWPGSGENGFAGVIAPYIDFNQNGKYEPALGDAPYIKGEVSACVVFNDNYNIHSSSNGNPIGAQILLMLDYYAGQDETTVFATYFIQNKSQNTYDDIGIGLWADLTLGHAGDEYVSTDSVRSAIKVFNANEYDSFPDGYGNRPPSLALVFLNKKAQNTMAIADDNSVIGNPANPQEYFNYLHGLWKDGSHLTSGFNGYQSGLETNYIFNGDACNLIGWTEKGSVLTPGKRRMLGSVQQNNFKRNDFVKLEVALIWNQENSASASLCGMSEKIDSVKAFYNKAITAGFNPIQAPKLEVFPNPATDFINIFSDRKIEANLYDVNGRKIMNMDIIQGNNSFNLDDIEAGVYFIKAEGFYSKILKK